MLLRVIFLLPAGSGGTLLKWIEDLNEIEGIDIDLDMLDVIDDRCWVRYRRNDDRSGPTGR